MHDDTPDERSSVSLSEVYLKVQIMIGIIYLFEKIKLIKSRHDHLEAVLDIAFGPNEEKME